MDDERKPPRQAWIYLRLSQDRFGDEHGITRQRDDCLRLLQQRGWPLAGTETDNDTSAAGRVARPAFLRLLAAVRRGEVGAIVAWSLDRLVRTARDRLALIEACQQHGVVIALVRGSDMDPTTPAGRLAIGILGEVAQHEIDVKSDRQRRAAEQAAEQGRWIGGRKPFGFEPDGVTVIPAEARAIERGYAALLAGVPLRAIAREWNSEGFRTGQTPRTRRDPSAAAGAASDEDVPRTRNELSERSLWRADAVRGVLSNPRYAGIRALRGNEYGPAEWEAVVPEETYRAALALLADPARHTGGVGAPGRQLLTGLARCAACGLTVHGGGASHRKPIYRCRGGEIANSAENGPHVNRLAAPVDDYVSALVVERLSRPDARDLAVDDHRPDLPRLRTEAIALRQRLERIAAEFGADHDTTPAEYRAMRQPIRDRLAAVEAEMADAGKVTALGDLIAAESVVDAWLALSVERQRAAINELMTVRLHVVGRGTRTFRPDTVAIEWKTEP